MKSPLTMPINNTLLVELNTVNGIIAAMLLLCCYQCTLDIDIEHDIVSWFKLNIIAAMVAAIVAIIIIIKEILVSIIFIIGCIIIYI